MKKTREQIINENGGRLTTYNMSIVLTSIAQDWSNLVDNSARGASYAGHVARLRGELEQNGYSSLSKNELTQFSDQYNTFPDDDIPSLQNYISKHTTPFILDAMDYLVEKTNESLSDIVNIVKDFASSISDSDGSSIQTTPNWVDNALVEAQQNSLDKFQEQLDAAANNLKLKNSVKQVENQFKDKTNEDIPSYDDWFNKKYTEWFEGEFSQWFDINYETYLSEQYDDYLDAQYSEHSNKNTEWRNEKYAQWYSEQHWELHDEKYGQWQDEKYFDWYYEQYYQLSDENAPSTAERTELLKSSDTDSFYSFDLRQELAA